METRIQTSVLHDKIIKMIGLYGYITIDEVALITGDRKKAYGVLQYLTTKGTLGTFSTRVRPTKAYYLPENMRRILEASGQVEYVEEFYPYSYRPSMFYHHVSLIKIHLILQKKLTSMMEFVPETQLKKTSLKKQKVCDGQFKYIDKDGQIKRVGIELELHLKNLETRKKSLRNLLEYLQENLDFVIIFYNNNIIKQRITETIKYLQNQAIIEPVTKGIYFVQLQRFLTDPAYNEAETLDGDKIELMK